MLINRARTVARSGHVTTNACSMYKYLIRLHAYHILSVRAGETEGDLLLLLRLNFSILKSSFLPCVEEDSSLRSI